MLKIFKDIGKELKEVAHLIETGAEETVASVKRNGFILDTLREEINQKNKRKDRE
jgi:hypothetical protein